MTKTTTSHAVETLKPAHELRKGDAVRLAGFATHQTVIRIEPLAGMVAVWFPNYGVILNPDKKVRVI